MQLILSNTILHINLYGYQNEIVAFYVWFKKYVYIIAEVAFLHLSLCIFRKTILCHKVDFRLQTI